MEQVSRLFMSRPCVIFFRTGGTLCYDEAKSCKIIIAAATIHNICIKKEIPLTAEDEHHRENLVIPNIRQEGRGTGRSANQRRQAVQLRQDLAEQFLIG